MLTYLVDESEIDSDNINFDSSASSTYKLGTSNIGPPNIGPSKEISVQRNSLLSFEANLYNLTSYQSKPSTNSNRTTVAF